MLEPSQKIDEILKGRFRHWKEALSFSEDKLELSARRGEVLKGCFGIQGPENVRLEGKLYSTEGRMSLDSPVFSGSMPEVGYSFDANGLEAGDVIKGDIVAVSELGEQRLCFAVSIKRNYPGSSIGVIRNLFHFTNLARENFAEAVRIFYSPEFEEIFDGADARFLKRYKAFAARRGSEVNVEEFLISIRKKTPVQFRTETEEIFIDEMPKNRKGAVRLFRSGWGHVFLNVDTDAPFISLPKMAIEASDFAGDEALVAFSIRPEKLHAGRNLGRIRLRGMYTDIEIELTLDLGKPREKEERRREYEKKKHLALLMGDYIDFRLHKIKASEWCKKSMERAEKLLELDRDDLDARMYMAQIFLAEGREAEAGFVLKHVGDRLSSGKTAPEYLAYYDYLEALSKRDDELTKKNADHVRELFKENPESLRLLWLMIFLDENLGNDPDEKLRLLSSVFHAGSRSPLLYIEALQAIKEKPGTLRVLDDFIIQCLYWGVQRDVMVDELKESLTYLSMRTHSDSPLLIQLLKAYYEKYGTIELLTAVCTSIMRSQVLTENDFCWFEKGVRQGLKITRLFESYMDTMPVSETRLLPRTVLLYFGMKADIPDDRLAFLYANMIRFRDETQDLLDSYAEHILSFATRSAQAGRINENYAEVYDYVTTRHNLENREDFFKAVSRLIFRRKIDVEDKSIRTVIIVEDGFKEERRAPVKDGAAYIDVYGGDYDLVLENDWGIRTTDAEGIRERTLFHLSHFVNAMREMVTENLGLSYYICGSGRRSTGITPVTLPYVKIIVGAEELKNDFREEYRDKLLQYLYDEGGFTELDAMLSSLDLGSLRRKSRTEAVRFMVVRGMHKLAFEALCCYGAEGVDPKVLVRLVSRMVRDEIHTDDPKLLNLAFIAFKKGKYDEVVLKYLSDTFSGPTRDMRDIWKAAYEFDIDVEGIEERILCQMLYSQSFIGEKDDIFGDYVEKGGREKVVAAWLSYSAFQYFVRDSITDSSIFSEILRRYRDAGELSDAEALALTRHIAEENPGNGGLLREAAELVKSLMERGIVMEYFSVFRPFIPALFFFQDRRFVEYRTEPGRQVLVHSMLSDGEKEGEYYKERMTEIYEGIFSQNYVLFFGETLQYYITEIEEGRSSLTESGSLEQDTSIGSRGESRFDMLNDILAAYAVGDGESLFKLMEQYLEKTQAVSWLFSLK